MNRLVDLLARRRARRGWRSIPSIPGPVHPHDLMLPAAPLPAAPRAADDPVVVAYREAGISAVQVLEAALARAGRSWSDVDRCLDLGCGFGRVTRWLVERLPGSRVTACDVHPVSVHFCARAFGARPLVVEQVGSGVAAYGRHDLVWAGSVITHLSADAGVRLVHQVVRALEPGGLFAVSFHGAFSLGALGRFYDGLYAADAEAIRREVATRGASYRRYARSGRFQGADYGMAWHDADWLAARALEVDGAEVEILSLEPTGWHRHHDVLTLRRTG